MGRVQCLKDYYNEFREKWWTADSCFNVTLDKVTPSQKKKQRRSLIK